MAREHQTAGHASKRREDTGVKLNAQAAAVRRVVQRVRSQHLSYALGRFVAVRRAYGVARGVHDRFRPTIRSEGGRPLFTPFDIDSAVDSLRNTAYYVTPRLPDDVVSAMVGFATDATLRRQGRPPLFKADEVEAGRVPGGEIAVLADVLDAERNEAVQAVANEPTIVAAVSKYLGYAPTNKVIRLIWSFVCEADAPTRVREGQTVGYHFDVHSYNFAYANFYLTDVDERSGAHTMIVGSHVDKPATWLFGSAMRTDDEIRARYAADREIALTGPPGFGFIQDSSCYHRALAPIDRRRLMLQVRYF